MKYSKIIPTIGKIVVGDKAPYAYLIDSIKKFYDQDELLSKIENTNFKLPSYKNLSGGIAAIHSAWKI